MTWKGDCVKLLGGFQLRHKIDEAVVCVVGLGFVGLTLATEFAKRLPVIGFDIDKRKVKELRDNNNTSNLFFTPA